MDTEKRISPVNLEPICKFGPGGDYVSCWPANCIDENAENTGPIGKVLSSIADIIGIKILPEMLSAREIKMEESKSDKNSTNSNAKTNAGSSNGLGLSKEPMLFDNPTRVGAKVRTKQNHSVRAHRRVKRKKPSFSQPWQGTLFEVNKTGTKVA